MLMFTGAVGVILLLWSAVFLIFGGSTLMGVGTAHLLAWILCTDADDVLPVFIGWMVGCVCLFVSCVVAFAWMDVIRGTDKTA